MDGEDDDDSDTSEDEKEVANKLREIMAVGLAEQAGTGASKNRRHMMVRTSPIQGEREEPSIIRKLLMPFKESCWIRFYVCKRSNSLQFE